MGHPHRLPTCNYRGRLRVFITACTNQRRHAFVDDTVSEEVTSQLLRHASESNVEVTAYCAMPDHMHALLRGLGESTDFRRMISQWKQSTGYWFRRERGACLWQGNYWDHVLREEEDPMFFVHYAVMNPVRSGLVERTEDYRWIGSSCSDRDELIKITTVYERLLGNCPG